MNDKGTLPAHWEVKKLGEVCEFEYGKALKKDIRDASGKYDVYGSNGIVGKHSQFIIEDPCVVVGRKGAAGEVHMSLTPAWPIDTTYFIKQRPTYDLKFLYYQLRSLQLGSLDKSTAIPGLNRNDAYQKKFVLPPLSEQQEIVSKIEELFSELDKGKEQLETARQQLKVYRQAVLKWAFEGRFTNSEVKDCELPEGWKRQALGDFITKIEAGKSFKCDERPPKEDEAGIVKVSSVTWGEFDQEESKTIFSTDQFNANYLIKSGDFLFSRANTIDLVGSCVIVKQISKQLMLSDKILRFNFNEGILKEYALYFLRTREGRREIESNSTGNQESMRNIGQQRIRQINIPVPSLEEQSQIVQEIESRLSVCDKVEETITKNIHQAETLRQSILKQAFEGKFATAQD